MSDDPARAPRGLFPIFLDVADLPVLVVGGGAVGCRRARSLVEAGARFVTIVSPRIDADAPAAARRILELFRVEHLEKQRLAFAATDSAAVNAAVARAAAERGILCCRADDAAAGDFLTPLAFSAGNITAAVSAGSPSLSRRVRDDLEPVAANWADLAAATVALRPMLLACEDKAAARAALADLATDDARDALAAGGPSGLRDWLVARHPAACVALPQ